METMTQVSVIMPLRNAEDFVVQALESVLRERRVPIEVIVVDDRSTDGSRARVQALGDPRVQIVDGPARGVAACLNTGLALARGDILMRCDADDLYAPERIAQQVAWLEQHPDHDAVCGAYTSIDPGGTLIAELCSADAVAEDITEELRRGITRTSLCTVAMRRRALERVGPFREYFVTSSDIDFLLRLGDACRVQYLPDNTYFYRLHEASITHTQVSVKRRFFEQTAREFQQQRRQTGADDLQRGNPPVPPDGAGHEPSTAASQMHGMLVGRSWRLFEQGQRAQALQVAALAVRRRPLALAGWRSFLVMALRSVIRLTPRK
jgi:glycosyltransferase involved in cell wall biosynthesis